MAKRKKVKRPVVPFTMIAPPPAPIVPNKELLACIVPIAPRKIRTVKKGYAVSRTNVPMPTVGRGASYRFAIGATKADAKRWNPLARQSTSAHGEVSTGDVTAKGNVRWAYGAPRGEMRCRSGDEISSGRWRQAG